MPGPGEAGEVVDVAVGLVFEDAGAEPDHLLRPEIVEQRPARSARCESSGLRFGLSRHSSVRQHRTLAVDVDRAALEHERRPVAVVAFDLQHLGGDPFVAVPGEVEAALGPAPGVEAPVDPAPPAVAVDDEGRAGVAHPGVVGGDLDHPHRGRQHRPAALELARRRPPSSPAPRRRSPPPPPRRPPAPASRRGASCRAAPARPSSSRRAARTRPASGSRRRRASISWVTLTAPLS